VPSGISCRDLLRGIPLLLVSKLPLAEDEALSVESQALLTKWLVGSTTGYARLRAGLPRTWCVGDKTGTGKHGTSNDVAIAWAPGHKPLLIAAYLTGSTAPASGRDEALAEVGHIIETEMANASHSADSGLRFPWTRV
jgi:beta-lactamase class A